MTEPAVWFTTMHGPLVGEWWECVAGGWGVVVIEHRTRHTVNARADNGQIFAWNVTNFLGAFTRIT